MQLLPGDGTYRALQDGAVTINIADYPSLQQDGGVVEGKAAGYPYPIIVVRLAGAYSALSGACPHQGCTVIPKTDGFRCPCHGSQFTLSGSVLNGPAQAGLDPLTLTQPSSGTLRITPPAV
ncbi:MAG: Rieske (2Fe-2S) protein [Deltaproteobacteria bacterium]|nr:MAG: Rieske (2Fe-2S) protein [Deltaproteobacteria bacterium]